MMSFDVLSRDLNVFEPHFLEASAGTGKTFAIEHLVVRLLIEGNTPFLIEQILVVTFTRASTRELKFRIRRSLVHSKKELENAGSSTDYLNAIQERGEASVKAAIDRIDAALICFDSAQIYTLHGFCHRILKEFAFEAAVGMEVSDPDEKDYVSLLEKMIRVHLKEEVSFPNYSPFQIKALLKKNQADPRKMVSSLAHLVASGKEIAPLSSYGELLEMFVNEICSLPAIETSKFKSDLSLLTPHYKQMTCETIPSQIDLIAEILSTKNCTQKQFDRLLCKDFFLEKMREDNKKVRAKMPELSMLNYPHLIEGLRKTLLPILERAKDPARIFLRLAKDLQEKSRDLLEANEKFSPDALLLRVEQALQTPRFVECVRQKFRAAIIDEFQDTDPVQWNIFQQLFLSNLDAVCLVGDPKQSIYAFRNADVYVYLEAAEVMGKAARKHLDTNFRSTASLVDALNLLFASAKGGWMDLPGRNAPLDVIPVKSGSGLISDKEASVEFFIAVDKKGRSKKFPTEEMFQNKIFPFLSSEISKLHTEKGIPYHSIAILIKDRFQGKAVIEYLKECGIPASAKRGGSIVDTTAYFALKEILAAVCSPFDMSHVKAALAGPLIAWQDTQLITESFLLDAKAKMQSLSRTLFEKGFGSFFQSFLCTAWGSKPLLQELFSRGDESLYLDLRKLSELLIEEEIEKGLKGEAFLLFLENLSAEAHRDESRLRVPSQEEKGSVTVMTMHMSKGLEFDAVFALGLASRHKISEQMAIKKEGRSVITLFNPDDPDAMQALRELDAEKMRQLYVALTRAKLKLYIPLMIEEDKKGIEMGEASPSELFFSRLIDNPKDHDDLYRNAADIDLNKAMATLGTLSPLIGYRLLQEMPKTLFAKEEAICELLQQVPLNLSSKEEHVLSFSSLAKKEHSFETMIPQICDRLGNKIFDHAPLSPHTMPLGADTGHLLHQIFEKIFKRKLHHPLDENKLSQLIETQVRFSPLEKWTQVLLPWFIALLKKPLCSFSLTDVPGENLQQEMEFFFSTELGMMKGFADLFFEFENKYYLLDWKSNYLGPSDEDYTHEKIAESMRANHYYLQASIYAEALKRYVKLFDNRPFSECFGGAIYYFIRGKAVFHFIPEPYAAVST